MQYMDNLLSDKLNYYPKNYKNYQIHAINHHQVSHASGYTHNDVRVPNIICSDNGYAHFIDFNVQIPFNH